MENIFIKTKKCHHYHNMQAIRKTFFQNIGYITDKSFEEKQGSGAEDSVGPHSGRPVLLWSTMKMWIV